MNTRSFLNRLPLFPNESLDSYLHRLRIANYYDEKSAVYSICKPCLTNSNDHLSRPLHQDTYHLLASLTGLSSHKLYLATSHRFTKTLTYPSESPFYIDLNKNDSVGLLAQKFLIKFLWPPHDVQYCPQCLAENPYQKISWLPMPVAACLNHRILLQRRCPNCSNPLSAENLMNCICNQCHFNLTKAPIVSVANDEWGLFSQRVIYQLFGLENSPVSLETKQFGIQSHSTLFYFLHGLSRGISTIEKTGKLHTPPTSLAYPISESKSFLSPTQIYTLYASAMKAVVNWPNGFFEYLDILRHENCGYGKIQQDFRHLYRCWLERRWRHESFNFVQRAFDSYLQLHYVISPSLMRLRRVRENPNFKKQSSYITEAEACRILGCSPETIHKQVNAGRLTDYDTNSPDSISTRFNLIRRSEVMDLQTLWQKGLSLNRTAYLLGISRRKIPRLNESGLLPAIRGPHEDFHPVWMFDFKTVSELQERIRHACIHQRLSDMTTLIHATQLLSAYNGCIATILTLIIEGELRAYLGAGQKTGRILVAETDLKKWLRHQKQERELVTRQYIADKFGVKPQTVTTWVEDGLIQPFQKNDYRMHFKKQDADNFSAQFIFSDDAAEILQVGRLVVQKWARNGRLNPVSGPGIDKCHRYLFMRKEVQKLSPNNRLTAPELAKELGLSRSQMSVWIKHGKLKPISGPGIDGMKHYLFLRSQFDENFFNRITI